jgi:hypothetical protein
MAVQMRPGERSEARHADNADRFARNTGPKKQKPRARTLGVFDAAAGEPVAAADQATWT